MFDTTKFGSCIIGSNSTVSCDVTDENVLKKIHLTAGDNCTIKIEGIAVLLNYLIIHMVHDCQVSLGRGQRMAGAVRLFMHEPSSIQIGDDCLWSDTNIWTSDMHPIFSVSNKTRTNLAEDVVVGNRVWFGFDSLVLKGARIEDDTVIGAKSVVIKGNYRKNVILSGFPAKEIRAGIYWNHNLT